MNYPIPKGTFDILPGDYLREGLWKSSEYWTYLEGVFRSLCLRYGYKEVRTPIFERTDLFVRSAGEGSDIVSKEMYNFEDKGGRPMTLRPEGTAPIMRSFIENHFDKMRLVTKFFYFGPYFRYDRPQAGRYRQLHQFGIEAVGEGGPEQDVEAIDLLYQFYCSLGLKNLTVLLNSIGTSTCRTHYQLALKDFLKPHFSELSEDSRRRFEHNPLRILDSKAPQDQALLEGAPSLIDYLSKESSSHFENVKKYLTELNIPFTVEPSLVRGLDYYCQTVFEVTSDALGAQNAIGGGGRFDGLLKSLGGPDLPAIGFATGVERILQTMLSQSCPLPEAKGPFLFLIPLGEKSQSFCHKLLYTLRRVGIPVELYLQGKKLQKALQTAESCQSSYSLIVGENELDSRVAQLKKMSTRETEEIPFDALQAKVETLWSQNL